MNSEPDGQNQIDYVGNELELFEAAVHWKRYLASRLRPYITGDVLEVGAGLGANIPYLHGTTVKRWVSLEPDARLCETYHRSQAEGRIPDHCELIQGTLEALPPDTTFDSILYVDVLEHIADHQAEFDRAYGRLRTGGHLAILCPAHNFLFSPFDKAIGHFRRYNKGMYCALSGRRPLKLDYLDSVGMMASVANRLLLKQSYPTANQIRLWDGLFVRLSSLIDPLTFGMVGKSILGIWRK